MRNRIVSANDSVQLIDMVEERMLCQSIIHIQENVNIKNLKGLPKLYDLSFCCASKVHSTDIRPPKTRYCVGFWRTYFQITLQCTCHKLNLACDGLAGLATAQRTHRDLEKK